MTDTEANRRLWVEALRSGQYTQGAGFLSRNGKYCCLGVACEVAMQHGVELQREIEVDTGVVNYGNETELPPGEVIEWLGLDTTDGALMEPYNVEGRDFHVLTVINDESETGFNEIADLIEQGKVKLASIHNVPQVQPGADSPPPSDVDRLAEGW